MKTIRLFILLTVISLFTTSPYIAAEARDCSNPEGFHDKLMCKKWKMPTLKMPTLKKKAQDSEAASTSENTEKSKKGGIGGIWKKIKNFGGKKIGEPG